MRRNVIRTSVILVATLLLPSLGLVAQETSSLLIEGCRTDKSDQRAREKLFGGGPISPDHGRILRFVGNQIILTLPGSADEMMSEMSDEWIAGPLRLSMLTAVLVNQLRRNRYA